MVDRPPIPIAPLNDARALLRLLRAIVVGLAKGLEWTGPEEGRITSMGRDVVADGGRGDAPCIEAHAAQGMLGELGRADASPTG